MRFSTKIFSTIFLTSALTSCLVGSVIYNFQKKKIEQEYISRYQTYGNIIANTFNQIEAAANLINENAVRVLYEIEKNLGLPSDAELNKLAKNLGIKAFYTTNKDGKFIRSTDLPIKMQVNSIFSYCKEYRLLIEGNASMFRTPIIPGFPYNIPMKLTMIPNYNRTLILESGIELNYIGKILHQVIKNDSNIVSIGFYTPMGTELGYITGHGKYYRGRRNKIINSKLASPIQKINDNLLIFDKKIVIPAIYCCECNTKKISNTNGDYFYVLRMQVSTGALVENLVFLRKKVILILLISFVSSLVISTILAKQLVKRLDKISKTALDILSSSNLDIRVNLSNNFDELSKFAEIFNEMIHSLKVSQNKIIESEKRSALFELGARVAHDIRSPLVAMDIVLKQLAKNLPEKDYRILSEGIHNIHDIADSLLNSYRNQEIGSNSKPPMNGEVYETIDTILLTNLVEKIISQKRQEWQRDLCKITLTIQPGSEKFWVLVNQNMLKRILSNLFNNAYDSIEDKTKGMVNVEVRLDNSHVIIKIHDNGSGIPIEKIPDILNGKSTKHSGKGLGVSTAKTYMDKISGQFKIISNLNEGTAVYLIFPCAAYS